ncbi:GNAT family N-acetyltransferase [Paenisporosarcina indica]|uniref:GNAT family N-acetyltransferase n=1 Tax=Paenisporosarcina indica TaxID=650093 RepID=UPI00094F4C92|nr:GNAT family N-acetyltransferase [Paenisporosarcina indica]
MLDFSIFPIIETTNLMLRKMHQNDAHDLFEMRSNPQMNEYTDTQVDATIEETKAYIEKMNAGVDVKKWIIWAIEHKQSEKVIGSISVWNLNKEENSGELGYGIIPDYQGQGLMKEALSSVTAYGFDVMQLDNLDAYTEENNRSSLKLLETSDFLEVDRVDEQNEESNRVYRMVVYRLVNHLKHR